MTAMVKDEQAVLTPVSESDTRIWLDDLTTAAPNGSPLDKLIPDNATGARWLQR
jgi:hypothetical protein